MHTRPIPWVLPIAQHSGAFAAIGYICSMRQTVPALAIAALTACGGSDDPGTDTALAPAARSPAHIESPEPGIGFGASIALHDGVLHVGAIGGPGAGRVYTISDLGAPELAFQEEQFGALGASMVSVGGSLYVAAPLTNDGAGAIWKDGELWREGNEGEMVGRTLFALRGELGLGTTEGLSVGEEVISGDARATLAIAIGEKNVVGTPQGEASVVIGEATLARQSDGDWGGFSLCSADLSGDSIPELVVGAPASGQVHIYRTAGGDTSTPHLTLTGPDGRFGHTVACRDGELVVGAPLHGENFEGAIWIFNSDSGSFKEWSVGTPSFTGIASEEQLGFSMLLTNSGDLYVGGIGGVEGRGGLFAYTW